MTASIGFSNLNEFNLDLTHFAETLVPDAFLRLQKKIALDLLSSIIFRTPVGNPDIWKPQSLPPPPGYVGGRARGNWQVGLNATNNQFDDNSIDPNGAPTLLDGQTTIFRATGFGVIWIFNNVPYITALEDGHSTQAPHGMVTLALAEAEALVP